MAIYTGCLQIRGIETHAAQMPIRLDAQNKRLRQRTRMPRILQLKCAASRSNGLRKQNNKIQFNNHYKQYLANECEAFARHDML